MSTGIFITGGGGVLGRMAIPLLRAAGHEVVAPSHGALDLLDPAAVSTALAGAAAVMHLATRIPPAEQVVDPAAWVENDVLRRDASRVLAGAARRSRPGGRWDWPGMAARRSIVDSTPPRLVAWRMIRSDRQAIASCLM